MVLHGSVPYPGTRKVAIFRRVVVVVGVGVGVGLAFFMLAVVAVVAVVMVGTVEALCSDQAMAAFPKIACPGLTWMGPQTADIKTD